jgi:hypothetical protein
MADFLDGFWYFRCAIKSWFLLMKPGQAWLPTPYYQNPEQLLDLLNALNTGGLYQELNGRKEWQDNAWY